MRSTSSLSWSLVAALAALAGCDSDPTEPDVADVEWSDPVHLGSVINSPATEGGPALSPDGLSLYFDSDRTDLPGALGAGDIYVSRRDCLTCPWQTPVNLGEPFNTAFGDGSVALSNDGLLMFYMTHGARPGCASPPCSEFLLVTRRQDPTDDFGWGEPAPVGPEVNNGERNNEPAFALENGQAMLYFERGTSTDGFDLFRAPIDADGVAMGAAEAVPILNIDGRIDAGPTISSDARELYLYRGDEAGSARGPTLDIWRSTRASTAAEWSAPLRVAPPLNRAGARDLTPGLSADGAWLIFASDRDDPGNRDLYISQRVSGG